MSRIRSINTTPERALRHALWNKGYRYRLNDRRLPGSPDIVLPKYHSVIFVHGCFWHGHKGCKYYTVPKSNTEFWVAKVARNQKRDQEVWRKLEAQGWHVIIVWECQLKKAQFESTIESVITEIRNNGERFKRIQDERRAARERYLEERRTLKEKESIILNEIKRVY